MGEMLFIIVLGIIIYFIWDGFRKEISRPTSLIISVEAPRNAHGTSGDSAELPDIEHDAWEPFDFYGAIPVPATGDYRIRYQDSTGLETDRDIHVKRVDQAGDHYAIAAFCQLRKAHRTFLNDRIRSAINVATGEIVEDVAQHAITAYKASPAGVIDELIAHEMEGLALLLFVARADGRMLKPERVEIARYLKLRDPLTPVSEETLEVALKGWQANDSINDFRRNVKTIAAKGDKSRLADIFACSKAIVATQKTVDPVEEAALKILESAIAEMPDSP